MFIQCAEPPANVENRFVRLCNTYDELIGFLSFGAFGLVPPPRFCGVSVAYRKHLSLAGVVVADMVSLPNPPELCGPILTLQKSKRPGYGIWAEIESRAYIFGAVRNEPDEFTDRFLQEIKARPDLFQYVTYSENDPFGTITDASTTTPEGGSGPLPCMRTRMFEAPRTTLTNRPQGYGDWTVERSAPDILFGKKSKRSMIGYLTQLKEGGSSGWFFHFKKFPVKYFAIIDPIPDRHHIFLAQQLAWVALRVKGYGRGEYEASKYARASDTFFNKCAAERLSWAPPGSWQTTKMAS